jgi:hypothetical protein
MDFALGWFGEAMITWGVDVAPGRQFGAFIAIEITKCRVVGPENYTDRKFAWTRLDFLLDRTCDVEERINEVRTPTHLDH